MLISDHMLISFEENVHPTCLYGTTRQLGTLEYFAGLSGMLYSGLQKKLDFCIHIRVSLKQDYIP